MTIFKMNNKLIFLALLSIFAICFVQVDCRPGFDEEVKKIVSTTNYKIYYIF